jgi:hypothetical protein
LPSVNLCIEDLAELIEYNASFLKRYPSCTYIIRATLEKLRELAEVINQESAPTIRHFVKFMEDEIWNSGSSTVSTTLDISTQMEFIDYLTEFLSAMSEMLKKHELERYLSIEEKWRQEFNSFLDKVKTSSTRSRSVKGATIKLAGDLQPWEMKFGELLNKYGLVTKADNPIFLLKSGYRSIYFFNPSHLVSRSNINDQENKEIMSGFREALSMFIPYMKKKVGEDKIAVLLTQKFGGEDPGTVQFGAIFNELGVPPVYLDPFIDALKGPVIEGDTTIVPFDGVATTLKTMDTIIKRYESILGKKPKVYSLTLNRSSCLMRDNVRVLSLSPPLVLEPEILSLSLATWNEKLGPMWPSLFPFHDYLKDIYVYAERSLVEYEKIHAELEEMMVDAYHIREAPTKRNSENTAYLFDSFDTRLCKSDIMNYLINVHILCWNFIFEIAFDGRISQFDNPIEFVENMLLAEKTDSLTIAVCPAILKEGIERGISEFPKLFDPWGEVNRIFIEKTNDILANIKDKYELHQKLKMKTIMKAEALEMVEERVKALRDVDEEFVKQGYKIDLEGARQGESVLRERLYELIKVQYKVVDMKKDS